MPTATRTPNRTRRSREARLLSESAIREARVDVEALRVEGIVILGPESKNPTRAGGVRRYTLEAMQEAVDAGVYEGVHAFVDHVTEDEDEKTQGVRTTRAFLGAFVNPRVLTLEGDKTRGKIVADLEVSEREAWFARDAARPSLAAKLGFSHDAMIDLVDTPEGDEEVVRIKACRSVDLVTTPATARSVFESKRRDDPMAKRTRKRRNVLEAVGVGAKVQVTNTFGEKVVGEVVKAGPAVRVMVGDRVHVEFEEDVTALEIVGGDDGEPAAPAAPAAEAEDGEDGEGSSDEEETQEMHDPEAEGGEAPTTTAAGDDDEEDDEMAKESTKFREENEELRKELAAINLERAIESLPAKAGELLAKRFEGKSPTKDQIAAAVAEVREAARAFGADVDGDDDGEEESEDERRGGPASAVTSFRRRKESAERPKDERSGAVRLLEAFGASAGCRPYAEKKIGELTGAK